MLDILQSVPSKMGRAVRSFTSPRDHGLEPPVVLDSDRSRVLDLLFRIKPEGWRINCSERSVSMFPIHRNIPFIKVWVLDLRIEVDVRPVGGKSYEVESYTYTPNGIKEFEAILTTLVTNLSREDPNGP